VPKDARDPRPPIAALERPREFELADRLHSAAIHLLRRLRRQDEAAGLTPARLSALSVIVFGGPIRLGDLAAAEGVRPPTMTGIVRELEAASLVRRQPDERDGRVVRVEATTEGRRVLEAGRQRRIEVLARALRDLDDAQLQRLEDGTELLELVVGARRHDR
jgi:DNA-binding MarR family transcriptional regulator